MKEKYVESALSEISELIESNENRDAKYTSGLKEAYRIVAENHIKSLQEESYELNLELKQSETDQKNDEIISGLLFNPCNMVVRK